MFQRTRPKVALPGTIEEKTTLKQNLSISATTSKDEELQAISPSFGNESPNQNNNNNESNLMNDNHNINFDNQNDTTTSPNNNNNNNSNKSNTNNKDSVISKTGLSVLALLATQNCFKNLLMRYVMTDKPSFLLSTAVITTESLKLFFSTSFILFHSKQSLYSIYKFIFHDDWKNTILLIFPATCYNLQMTLEYIAFANIDAASFAVIVQMKMLTTAFFFRLILGKRLKKKQVMSLVLLTVGVMLCNMKTDGNNDENEEMIGKRWKGIMATCGIATTSGFASVYTERVIKSSRAAKQNDNAMTMKDNKDQYGLAYMQCQLATVSLFSLGIYASIKDWKAIVEDGLFQNFNETAFLSCANSAVGGLIVASVLKYADSVLKGYATAGSVVLTGVLSSYLFKTELSMMFGMGMINVVMSTMLYSGSGLDEFLC